MARVNKLMYNTSTMESNQTFMGRVRRLFAQSPPDQSEDVREVRPFFLIVMAVLAFLYGVAVYGSPPLRAPARLIPFTVLMLAHAALHWFSPRLASTSRWSILYLAVQGALAFVLTLLANNTAMILGLYIGLIGEAIGILRNARLSAVAVIVYLGLATINFVSISGWQGLLLWALATALMAFFVVAYVSLYSRQVEARDRAQALLSELETAHKELAEYAARVEDLTLAAERQRMARELHDTLSQGLAGLILQLEAANSHLTSGRTERAQAILQQAMARARDTLADARRAIGDLRQGAAIHEDLTEAVREEADHFATATGIPCTLDLDSPPLPDDIREHALRVVSEGLTNVARHAQASQVWIRLASSDDGLEVEVRDDGVGFDPAVAAAQSGHYGLLGMRERARLAGGTLVVESAPGKGTVLRLCVPFNR
jgi:two-component system, NarL family, sensor histidine kinase YdfH